MSKIQELLLEELNKALDKQAWGIAHDILTGITAVQDLESWNETNNDNN